MTSVEKRRSSRKSAGHRKHSDGGYSDTSSGGSFLDETDREVSNLTDRAFRSLCIGDEAVYNDSDLSSSPCFQRDRQLAFSQVGQDREDREREELKRAAHDSFSLRVQQYGQDWIHGGTYGAEIHQDPQWGVYGERRTQGRASATFQHSFVETSQQEQSLKDDQLSFLSNGATELSSQQRRSRSRVSSLIRAFNSEGQRDGMGMDGKLRDWNDETSWDKSALMSIERELSEFSTSYQQNINTGYFPSAGLFSSRNSNFYSSEVAAVQMNSASSFMRSSHSKHSMSTQVNCNSNFFIHSEFSPFKVWRDYNRFPFQQGEVSGFMHHSEFPKWYQTPMYKELSLEAQQQGPTMFQERGIRYPRNTLAPVVTPTHPRSTSTSTVMQKASALEKRCESELAGHYPHRKRTQSLGANRLPSQRPSTASPSSEMSRRVRDTLSSVKALQQKIKTMAEQNITLQANQDGVFYNNDNFYPYGNNAGMIAPNVVSSNTSATPFNISQLLTPLVHAPQEPDVSEVHQYPISLQPVEHPPVCAESRGATPDVRMSSYKSRATSLLFNLKDNRKRVKSTYSPTRFKGLEMPEKNKQVSVQESRDTMIEVPDFSETDISNPLEEKSRVEAALHQYENQYHSTGLSVTAPNSQPMNPYMGQNPEYYSSERHRAQMQGEMAHQYGFTGFVPENYTNNQLANGQNLYEDLSSFTPYKQSMTEKEATVGDYVNRLGPSYSVTEMQWLNADNNQTRDYLISKANTRQHFNEPVGGEFTRGDRYHQVNENKYDYSNVSSQDRWRQTNNQEIEKLSLKAAPMTQEKYTFLGKDQNAEAYQRAVITQEELNSLRYNYKEENQKSVEKKHENTELRESYGVATSSYKKAGQVNPNNSAKLPQYAPLSKDAVGNPGYYKQEGGTLGDKYAPQISSEYNAENEMKDNYVAQNNNTYTNQGYTNLNTFSSNEEKTMLTQDVGQRKQYVPILKENEVQSLQPREAKIQLENNRQKNVLSVSDNANVTITDNQVKDEPFVEVKAAEMTAEQIIVEHAQTELAKTQHWAQVEQPKAELNKLILAEQTGSEKVKAEKSKVEVTKQDRIQQNKVFERADKDKSANIVEQEKQGYEKEEKTEQSKEEKPKVEQPKLQMVPDEPGNIVKAGVGQMREGQGEQVKAEQATAERLKEERIKTELSKGEQTMQIRAEHVKTEQSRQDRIKTEQDEKLQVKIEHSEKDRMEVEEVRTEIIKSECVKPEDMTVQQADVKEETQVDKSVETAEEYKPDWINAEQPKTEINKAKSEMIKAEMTEGDKIHVDLTEEQITKAEIVQDMSAKPAAELPEIQQVKGKPDKLEQVKTELAKAKAELAKIKDKMKGEQKEKVKNTVLPKDDDIKKENINENKEIKTTPVYPEKEGSVNVIEPRGDQDRDRGANEYQRLREKYGFIQTTNKNRASTEENASSNNVSETSLLADKLETANNNKPKDDQSPISGLATAKLENKDKAESNKSQEMADSHYVYSESLKEFKLTSAIYLTDNGDKIKSNTVPNKVKEVGAEKLEKQDKQKNTDVSQQKDSDLERKPLEKKPKSTDHSGVTNKDSHLTPLKALTHKEKAQTKQEILTSKIKAHAEKEISAIKEGFATRDGFMSKNSTKQLPVNQNINIRQRPPSQEVSRKQESNLSTNSTLKQQSGSLGAQADPVKSVSPPYSATVPPKSFASTGQSVDHFQKQVPKEPMKNTDNMKEPPKEANWTEGYDMKQDQSEVKSPKQNKEPMNGQVKQEANREESSKKHTEKMAIYSEPLNDKKVESKASPLVKPECSKPENVDQAENKNGANQEDSAPSLKFVFAQTETTVPDDDLKIMGIMVTVRERKPSLMSEEKRSNQKETHTKEKECSLKEQEKCGLIFAQEVTKVNRLSEEVCLVKSGAVQENQHTVKGDQTRFSTNTPTENKHETPTTETRKNNLTESGAQKTPHQESSAIKDRYQREIQLQDHRAEKDVPFTTTVPAKNKLLAETQPVPPKQDIIPRETKDYTNKTPDVTSASNVIRNQEGITTKHKNPQNVQREYNNKTSKTVTTEIYKNTSNKADSEIIIKYEIQPSVSENQTEIFRGKILEVNESKINEKQRILAPPEPYNKNNVTDEENSSTSLAHKHKGTNNDENTQGDDKLHIDSIAIRVVPAGAVKENVKMAQNYPVANVAAANETKQTAPSSNDEGQARDGPSTSREKEIKHSLMEKAEAQNMLSNTKKQSDSLKPSSQQNSINKSENTGKINETADDVERQTMDEDYFQVQGITEKNNKLHNNSTNVGDASDIISKERELPRFLPNTTTISNESNKEGKNDKFALDQSKRKTLESRSVGVQDGNMNVSKQNDRPTEGKSSKNERMEAGPATHNRKHHTENQPTLAAKESQSTRSLHPTRENAVKEKPEVKTKPKVSTIPEISALADYARLKVIVSDDCENTLQEFPPNKKEGFFPLIQTRHSRRPVFTMDAQDVSVKEKSLPNKTEVNAKVNKEPKAVVFPITEKEHQRTGMFKLGDKEKLPPENNSLQEMEVKNAQGHKERNKSPLKYLMNKGNDEQVAEVNQLSQSIHQVNNPPLQTTTTSSSVNKPRQRSLSRDRTLNQKPKEFSPKGDGLPYMDKNTYPQQAAGPMYNTEASTTSVRKDVFSANEMLQQEKLATQHEETKASHHNRAKQSQEAAEAQRIKHMLEESRASLAEEERRAAQREEERRAKERKAIAAQIKERREKQKEAERIAEEERRTKQVEEEKAAQREKELKANQREEERKIKELEEKKRVKIEEERKVKLREEERMKAIEERRRIKQKEEERAALEEQQKRRTALIEEQQRKAVLIEEQKKKAVLEEQQITAALEEQKRKAALMEEQQRKTALEEQQRKAALEEQQRKAALIEEQKKAALEEQQRKAALEEQQRKAALIEDQKRKAALEEQQRKAALIEEQQRRAAMIEEQKKAALQEQQRKAALIEEQKRKAALEEQQRTALIEEHKRKAALEEQQRKAAMIEEQKRKAALGEQQRAALIEEQKRKAALEEQQRKAALEEQRQAALVEEQKRKAALQEQQQAALIEEQRRAKQAEDKRVAHIKEERKRRQIEEEEAAQIALKIQREEEESRAAEKEKQAKEAEQRVQMLEEKQAAQQIGSKKIEGGNLHQREEKASGMEDQKSAAQRRDALQYYSITSEDGEKKPRERHVHSPLSSQQRNNPSGLESPEDPGSYSRQHRPLAPESPASSLPRSNTSSPALGIKPSMFRVKDNTNRGSALTKSVKPRFHKTYGEDFRVGSPMERLLERGEEEQELMRRSAGTPVHPDTGLNRLTANKEPSNMQSSPGYSTPVQQHRPYSRRSIAFDEDDSRSVISNISEDVESFATSAADLADVRGLFDSERPESACSYSSDVSRSLGRPPAVPPKSEKALRRAQRLTTRRMKKELSKAVAESPAGGEKLSREVSTTPSSSTEVRSFNQKAVTTPHFSAPVSLAHAPTSGSGLHSSHAEHQSSHRSFHASPHVTDPVSLPVASPHATAPISVPVASSHGTGPVSHAVAPKTLAHIPSSPTLHHKTHPAPVTQYHVESSYPQSYPVTQRKVLQDIGSGQYFVVDVPVPVQTKTFFDPETGKYVQLNVRESGRSTSQPQSQQTYPQPQPKPQMQVKSQQQPVTQASPAGKSYTPHSGYHSYPQGYQSATVPSVPTHQSTSGVPASVTFSQDQQPIRENSNYRYHSYSPEKTPYMDTVNDADKTYNTVYNTHGSHEAFPQSDTNSQLAGSSVCENDNSAHSRYQSRDIITMSELEDFMEVSDW